jgi:hypothetical protein
MFVMRSLPPPSDWLRPLSSAWFPPSAVYRQLDVLLKVCCPLPDLFQGKGSLKTLTPGFELNRPKNKIRIPHNPRHTSGECMREFGLQFILMRDNQFACWTVPTGLAEDCQVAPFHVDQKRKLPEIHQLLTSRAPAETEIRIWIQCERILRWQPPKTVLVHISPNILTGAAMTHNVVTTQLCVIIPCGEGAVPKEA